MKKLSFVTLLSLFTLGSGISAAVEVPEFMRSFVIDENQPISKENIAFNNIYTLNETMFTIYDRSSKIYQKNFLSRHHLIMGLFSGKGGRFILYRPGQAPLEADPVPSVYRVAKAIGHCAMATFVLLAPYTADPSLDFAWVGSLTSYRTNVQTAMDSLSAIDVEPSVRELFQDTLKQIATFMDACIKNRTFTYDELHAFTLGIKPNLAKLIDVATNAQVNHWWNVLDKWKKMIGKDWDTTYGLSNTIYVARQNNILFSILVQFFGEDAINDRLILLETRDFTTTPEAMMDAFIRIVADRMIGKVFFKNERLMDFELLGGSARTVIEAEAEKRGLKAILPPRVPFDSHEWPWKVCNPSGGTGPVRMEDIH